MSNHCKETRIYAVKWNCKQVNEPVCRTSRFEGFQIKQYQQLKIDSGSGCCVWWIPETFFPELVWTRKVWRLFCWTEIFHPFQGPWRLKRCENHPRVSNPHGANNQDRRVWPSGCPVKTQGVWWDAVSFLHPDRFDRCCLYSSGCLGRPVPHGADSQTEARDAGQVVLEGVVLSLGRFSAEWAKLKNRVNGLIAAPASTARDGLQSLTTSITHQYRYTLFNSH